MSHKIAQLPLDFPAQRSAVWRPKEGASYGHVEKAVEIALDIEQLIYEVTMFLNAASMMHRIRKP
jgi:hypothetical protein